VSSVHSERRHDRGQCGVRGRIDGRGGENFSREKEVDRSEGKAGSSPVLIAFGN
jgi:hypothetical protein